jgi:PadR family transcriptional regulator, regulatory protein PadR
MRHAENDPLFELEQLVLLAILRLGDQAYGIRIIDELATLTHLRVSRPSVYTTLARLQRKGMLSSELGDPIPERGGRARRFYRATPAALSLLRDSRQAYLRLWSGLETILDPAR